MAFRSISLHRLCRQEVRSKLNGGRYYADSVCRELTITHTNAVLNFKNLAELSGLEKIHLPEGHKKYVSEDGSDFFKGQEMPCILSA